MKKTTAQKYTYKNMPDIKRIPDRETTKELLTRLKSQETVPPSSNIQYLNIKQEAKPKEASTIPEYNIENILRQINSLEKKMQEDTRNYLNLFYDLRKLEDKFSKAVEFIKVNNIHVKDNVAKEISTRENIISRRGKKARV